ncbi:hypothetical protein MA16_Dca001068 [Dendrobium catenatum]|uniref:Uncharacterized protein n=1 Tax=Dendrobium catenatum TaxID=906689 RepID=A0A2I0WLD6_9ASPA|nr:hypothetical protein MA16_Dca001068 [Dendrobium catenatum]
MNNWVFDSCTIELSSTGLNFTWFNQRADDPIHIKSDKMLVNHLWLDKFLYSYFKVEPPSCSDQSPLILLSGTPKPTGGRFLFKNFWINMDGYWNDVIFAFSKHYEASPIANLYHKLKYLKFFLK